MSEAKPSDTDESVFSVQTLVKYMGGDDKALAIVARIVRDACAPGLTPLKQARAAADQGQALEAAKIFHGLRGSVGTLGTKRFVEASLLLEQALAAGQSDQYPPLFAAVESEYILVLQRADAWLQSNAPTDGAIPT